MGAKKNGATTRNWEPFALLLIDVQKDFWNEETAAAFPGFARNVTDLLNTCRRENIDIVHIRAEFKKDQSDWMTKYKLKGEIPCVEGSVGVQVFDYALEKDGELIVTKQTFDGFYSPELDSWLKSNGKKHVLVAGLITSVCVLLTSASAAQRGYLVSVVEDCCADAPTAHHRTVTGYPFIFETVLSDQIAARNEKWLGDLLSLTKEK